MKRTIKLTILLSLIFLMIPLFAQHGRGGKGMKDHKGMKALMKDEMLEEAGVPEAKRAEIRKKGHEVHKKMMDLNFKVGELRFKVRAEYEKSSPNIKTLKNLNKQIAELRKEQFLVAGDFKVDTFASLTVPQRKKLMELMKERKKEFMGRMKGKRGGKKGGKGRRK